MGREASATVRALLRCLRQVSSESPRCGLGSWPAGAWGSPLCLTSRRGARRGVRSASSGWTSALVQRTDRLTRVDPDPAVPFSLSGSARSFARRMSGRGRKGSDEPSRDAPAHRVNDQITARQIRLVVDLDDRDARAAANEASNADPPSATDSDSDSSASSSTASRSTHEVLSTLVALRRARLAGLDLVEVNARADPPVCRLMRYDSFRYAQKQREREGRRAAVERRRADTVKELKLTARIGPNDVRVKADKARKFLTSGHKVALRVEFKTNDGVKPSLRPKAGAVLFDEFRACLAGDFATPHVVAREGKMVGPNHMTVVLAPEPEARMGKSKRRARDGPTNAAAGAEASDEAFSDARKDANDASAARAETSRARPSSLPSPLGNVAAATRSRASASTPARSRAYSGGAPRAGERVGAAKARAKSRAAKAEAKKRAARAGVSLDDDAMPVVREARVEDAFVRSEEGAGSEEARTRDASPTAAGRDPSPFRLGDATREGDGSSRDGGGDARDAGAWAGAAAAATFAAAAAATFAAAAAAEPPRVAAETSETSLSTEIRLRTRETKKPTTHPALSAAVAFAGGVGVVVSALGCPPGGRG